MHALPMMCKQSRGHHLSQWGIIYNGLDLELFDFMVDPLLSKDDFWKFLHGGLLILSVVALLFLGGRLVDFWPIVIVITQFLVRCILTLKDQLRISQA